MPTWTRPNLRKTTEPQIEFCDLCGSQVSAQRLVQSEVQGLRGARICDLHPAERLHRINPSFDDLGGLSNVASPAQPDLLPHAGTDWTGATWDTDAPSVPSTYLTLQEGSTATRARVAAQDGSPLTIEAWVYLPAGSTASGPLISTYDYAHFVAHGFLFGFYGGGNLWFATGTGLGGRLATTVAGLIADATWTHIAVVYTAGAKAKFYVNGALATNFLDDDIGVTTGGTEDLVIQGGDIPHAAGTFVVSIADLRIWPVARTGAQIAANYASALTDAEAATTVLYMRMNDNANTITDSGPWSINATITDPHSWGTL